MPQPDEIKKARNQSGLTQSQAAALVEYSMRAWQDWEAGKRKMRQSVFNRFITLTQGDQNETR